jgi:2-amino-4-hydroxy-6-hydroxymethyldihydropteridine diphosphokinase
MAEVLLGLGGNVGDVRATLNRAVELLCDENDVHLVARSSDYRTPPWGVTDQPDFVNLCLVVETALSPHALLERVQAVEKALGRDRSKDVRWGPRPIDIDLLAYDAVQIHEPDLQLPHPHMFERAFVLVPLAEIAPDRVVAGIKIAAALKRIDTSGVTPLPPRLSQLV